MLSDMNQKEYELMGCWTNYTILTFDPTHDLDLDWFFWVKLWNGCVSGIDECNSYKFMNIKAIIVGVGKDENIQRPQNI